MPTPVITARQCLTEEAARYLDDAVSVARRRCHAQTTSLHVVSALLALPSSSLREACARARSSAYSPRLQFRALELSVGVSLDRLPTAKGLEEPPISNSLMAAIKRSQANQRRHPETFQFYQNLHYLSNNSDGTASSQPSISAVKVELKHFILSILDDPVVSRVFGEAGFRSCDIKLAILNPPPAASSRFSKTRLPPLFLCNLSELELNKLRLKFPFPGVLDSDGIDENSRRIAEILVKKNGKNALLVGVCAIDALNRFTESVQKGQAEFLPKEINNLSVITFENEIIRSDEMIRIKLNEVDEMMGGCKDAGVVVNYGDLKVFVDHGESEKERVNQVVFGLSRLLEIHKGSLWLIGATASYDTYMKFLGRFPSVEKDWDLHLLPITSSILSIEGSYSRPGLMGSFVPFGGFFTSSSDINECTSNNKNLSAIRCSMCDESYEQEAAIIVKGGGSTASVADQPSWMRMAEKNKIFDIGEANDDKTILNARLTMLQTKWNDICQHLHCNQPNISPSAQSLEEATRNNSGSNISSLQLNEKSLDISKPSESQNIDFLKPGPLEPGVDSYKHSPEKEKISFMDPLFCTRNSKFQISLKQAPCTISPVTTDLGLGNVYSPLVNKPNKLEIQQHKDHIVRTSPSSLCGEKLGEDFKSLWKVINGKIGWQDDAVYTICQTVSNCRNGHGRKLSSSNRGNIWLSFHGPDKIGKRRISSALAEAVFGNSENLLRVDLGYVNNFSISNTVLDRHDHKICRVNFRGKTPVDHIAEELSKKSNHVFLLENIDNADMLVQHSLSQAIRTGKFPDSYGREISVNNVIFLLSSDFTESTTDYSEDRILSAIDSEMRITVGFPSCKGHETSLVGCKRKLIDQSQHGKSRQKPKHDKEDSRSSFDLNLPVEEMEEDEYQDNNDSGSGSGSGSESSKTWVEDLWDQMDGRAMFKPLDIVGLEEKVLNEIKLRFQEIFGKSCLLEMEYETRLQIIAAVMLSERKEALEEWITKVLCKGFKEIKMKYKVMSENVVKLMRYENNNRLVEDHASGIFLPNRVFID